MKIGQPVQYRDAGGKWGAATVAAIASEPGDVIQPKVLDLLVNGVRVPGVRHVSKAAADAPAWSLE